MRILASTVYFYNCDINLLPAFSFNFKVKRRAFWKNMLFLD